MILQFVLLLGLFILLSLPIAGVLSLLGFTLDWALSPLPLQLALGEIAWEHGKEFILVAVPTPVNHAHQPDFEPLLAASRTIGAHMRRGAIVVSASWARGLSTGTGPAGACPAWASVRSTISMSWAADGACAGASGTVDRYGPSFAS